MTRKDGWPDIPRQPSGSRDCTFYAASYLCGLLGFRELGGEPMSGERVKRARLDSTDAANPMETFPQRVYGVTPAWVVHGMPWEERRGTCYSFAPGFRRWVRSWCNAECVAYAVIHLSERGTHAVILLEADKEGVVVADPIRGVVRESWEAFESPLGDNRPGGKPTRVEAWYGLPRVIRPADCPHPRATFRAKRPEGKKAYACPDCRLVAVGGGFRAVKERFERKVKEERARSIFLASF